MKNQLQEQQRRVQNAKNEHQKRKKEHEKGMFQSFFRKYHFSLSQILFPNYKVLKNSFFGTNFEVSNFSEINFETNKSPTELCKAHRKK